MDDQLTMAPPLPASSIARIAVLHAEEHAAQVDVHRPVVVLHGDVGEHDGVGDAGHVEHGVETPELLDRGPDHGLDVGFLRDVAVDGQDALADLGRGVLLGAADVARDDLGALTHEDLHRRLRHARPGAGDDRHLAVQHPHHQETPFQRTVRKKFRRSSVNSSGCSMAAKWPPRGMTAQCVTLYRRSTQERGKRNTSLG